MVPESKGILISILLSDMLNTIFREVVALSAQNENDNRSAAIAAVVFFVLVIVVFFGTLAAVNLVYLCWQEKHNRPGKVAILVADIIGALLYFYADNIHDLLTDYGEVLGCGGNCIENNRIASTVCLGVVLLFHHMFPPCFKKLAKLYEKEKGKATAWHAATNMLTTILKIDALYSAIALMAQTDEFCGKTDLSVGIASFVIYFISGVGLMLTYASFSSLKLKRSKDGEVWWWIVPVTFILLFVVFPMYLLADSSQPLDCAFGCDTFSANQTRNELSCNSTANSSLRLVFTVFNIIVVSTLSLLLFCCRHNIRGEGIV